ncbi:hypothetical protein NQ317_013542 [Molorchus minor]|uniref:Uncharacterized protein n=1 Tax=Molorchus minor TaxID=1323400 RepID=A0ABQ9JV86_9CUCU|nr:hypothetical protein NQ317_013542 [Molorchus minor]
MSILAYNGGAMVAMKGEGCVSIAADRRFGIQAQTLRRYQLRKDISDGPHVVCRPSRPSNRHPDGHGETTLQKEPVLN